MLRALAVAIAFLAACAAAPRTAPEPIVRETGFVSMEDGTRVYYDRAGKGPTVLFIHGLGGNHTVWFQQVPHFARSHRVITISQRGFAPSTTNSRSYDNEQLVADAAAVLDRLGATDVVVVGQSMGGWTALGLALRRPDLVSSLILAGTVAGIFDDEIREHYRTVTTRARNLGEEPPPMGRHPAIDDRLSERDAPAAYLYQLLASFGSPPAHEVAGGLGRSEFGDAELSRLRVPTLFLVGERDAIFPPRLVRRAAARIPHARVVVLGRSGHSPYFERADAWNREVARFLAAHH